MQQAIKVITKNNQAPNSKNSTQKKFFKFIYFMTKIKVSNHWFFIVESSNSFVFEKCLHPKKPLSALNGDGCAAFKTKCFVSSISDCFSCAKFPHNKKTIPSF